MDRQPPATGNCPGGGTVSAEHYKPNEGALFRACGAAVVAAVLRHLETAAEGSRVQPHDHLGISCRTDGGPGRDAHSAVTDPGWRHVGSCSVQRRLSAAD